MKIKVSASGLRLYDNENHIADQTRTIRPVTGWELDEWYVIELEAQGTTLKGRLYDDYTEAKVLEEAQAILSSVAHDSHERADWFQSEMREPAVF